MHSASSKTQTGGRESKPSASSNENFSKSMTASGMPQLSLSSELALPWIMHSDTYLDVKECSSNFIANVLGAARLLPFNA